MRVSNIEVHRTHCCIIHGCKYGDNDCPVINAEILQNRICRDCNEMNLYLYNRYTYELIKSTFLKRNREAKLKNLPKNI